MPEALEMAGRGVRLVLGALTWVVFAIAIVVAAPFMVVGWAAFRLGLVD